MKVYLAGGFESEWRSTIKKSWLHEQFDFIDPQEKENRKEFSVEEYICWDLYQIKNCDIVFCYISKDNPSGYGACVELGYAEALGKTVITVIEKNHPKYKYILFTKGVSDVVYDALS